MKRASLSLVFAILMTALLGAVVKNPPSKDDPTTRALVTSARASMASSGHFYLELLLSKREIRLCHSGAWLAAYPLESIRAGYPRIFFFSLERHENWIGDIWTDGRLDPPAVINRVEIVPGDDSTIPTPGEANVLPPTLEELIPVPRVFDIRFDGGRVIRVVLKGKIPGAAMKKWSIAGRWRDFLSALGMRRKDKVRLLVTLSGAEGAALFRSFPAGHASLVVVP